MNLNESFYKSNDGKVDITYLHLLVTALGALGLYFAIPSRKRKNLFK